MSTTPRWVQGKLEPRPFVLRVYCAATTDGWRVMPGGFCRISDRADARAVSMGDGVESADVWVLAENPVEVSSLLPSPEGARITRLLGNLPSRAADNLFWFGRYLERAEATLRVVRCLSARSVDPDAPCAAWPSVARSLDGGFGRVGRDRSRNAAKGGRGGQRARPAQSGKLWLRVLACSFRPQRGVGYPGATDASDLGADLSSRKFGLKPARERRPLPAKLLISRTRP